MEKRTLIYVRNNRGGVAPQLLYGSQTNGNGKDVTDKMNIAHKVEIPDTFSEMTNLDRLVALFPCPQEKIREG